MVGLVLHKGMRGFFFRHTQRKGLMREREKGTRGKKERQGGGREPPYVCGVGVGDDIVIVQKQLDIGGGLVDVPEEVDGEVGVVEAVLVPLAVQQLVVDIPVLEAATTTTATCVHLSHHRDMLTCLSNTFTC